MQIFDICINLNINKEKDTVDRSQNHHDGWKTGLEAVALSMLLTPVRSPRKFLQPLEGSCYNSAMTLNTRCCPGTHITPQLLFYQREFSTSQFTVKYEACNWHSLGEVLYSGCKGGWGVVHWCFQLLCWEVGNSQTWGEMLGSQKRMLYVPSNWNMMALKKSGGGWSWRVLTFSCRHWGAVNHWWSEKESEMWIDKVWRDGQWRKVKWHWGLKYNSVSGNGEDDQMVTGPSL
jgi:hypothetical protein